MCNPDVGTVGPIRANWIRGIFYMQYVSNDLKLTTFFCICWWLWSIWNGLWHYNTYVGYELFHALSKCGHSGLDIGKAKHFVSLVWHLMTCPLYVHKPWTFLSSCNRKRRWCRRRRQWRRRYRSDVVFDVCRNCSDVLLVRRIGPKENNFSDTLLIAGNGCSHV